MIDDSLLPFSLPSVDRKKITAAFDGGRISSDGGVMLLALAERRMPLGRMSSGGTMATSIVGVSVATAWRERLKDHRDQR